jgi:predicted HAD superfamily hydrolase
MIHSFDIFDTVLTRRTFRPRDIHLLVARDLVAEGLWKGSLVEWRSTRESAERTARGASAREEIALADIELQLRPFGGTNLAARAVELELLHELAETVGIRSTLTQAADLMAKGVQVVYTSDMYLPIGLVTAMLDKAGAPRAPVFLSSELGMTKRSGGLFRHIAAHFDVSLRDIQHAGDHRDSDYKIPRRLGVGAVLFQESAPTLLERDVYRALADCSPLLATTFAGSMRAARLTLAPCVSARDYLALLGTQEGALVHIGYALWLVHKLVELKPGKASFLARDGYLPMKMFEVLAPRFDGTLPLGNYTYASRQALHLAGLKSEITEEDRAWIMVSSNALTFSGWLFRLGITRDELGAVVLGRTGIPDDGASFSSCKKACTALLDSPAFMALVLQKARQARDLAREYLTPGIAPERGDTAVIDIGWNGRMQRSMVDILSLPAACCDKIHGFYLGILRTPTGSYGSYSAWLFDLRHEPRPYCASHFHLFETLYAAPHATTYGYLRNGAGRVVPMIAPSDAMAPIWPDLIDFQNTILDICAGVRCDLSELIAAQSILRSFCRKTVAVLFRAPRWGQAKAFEGMTFSSDQTDLGKQKLLYALDWKQQYKCFFEKKFQLSANHWREGQLALADAPGLRLAFELVSTFRMWAKNQLNIKQFLRRIKTQFHWRRNSA